MHCSLAPCSFLSYKKNLSLNHTLRLKIKLAFSLIGERVWFLAEESSGTTAPFPCSSDFSCKRVRAFEFSGGPESPKNGVVLPPHSEMSSLKVDWESGLFLQCYFSSGYLLLMASLFLGFFSMFCSQAYFLASLSTSSLLLLLTPNVIGSPSRPNGPKHTLINVVGVFFFL